jgi:hypothetical protein
VNISAVMDEIAVRLRTIPSIAGRTYAWPPASITPPAAFVDYPGPGAYDLSYGRGADRTTGTAVVALGRPSDPQTRDPLTGYIDGSGAESVKAAVDGDAGDYDSCDSVTVTGWDTNIVSIGGMEYLAAVFTLDIIGRGTS